MNRPDALTRGSCGKRQGEPVGELKKMEYEPLMPIEKKLIVWSLGLGVLLLALLVWACMVLCPPTAYIAK